MKYILAVILFFGSLHIGYSQNQVKWMTWQEAMEANAKRPKKIFVNIYTDWCNICKKMDATSMTDNDLAKYINDHFYPVKFNAETSDKILFKGQRLELVRVGKQNCHELALALTRGNVMYPTFVFLDEETNIIQPIPGYQTADDMMKIVRFYGDDFYQNTPWMTYINQYTYESHIISVGN